MIVVDTSALLAILLREAQAESCFEVILTADRLLFSAASFTEALIVSARRKLHEPMIQLIESNGLEIVPLTAAGARRAGDAYQRWGKGFHPAKLTFGDCFAYALAKEHACPLLYVGNDFAQTDIVSAL